MEIDENNKFAGGKKRGQKRKDGDLWGVWRWEDESLEDT
jgi:hypothetical protein